MKSANVTALRPKAPVSRRREEQAFLPAALEIVETPVAPFANLIGIAIIALFCIALVWAAIGKIDIVATSSGKIIPSGRTKVVQPFETGVVRAIHVHDGQAVKAGDVLVELDPTMNNAELKHFQSDLVSAELDVARLSAALSEDPEKNFVVPPEAGAEAVEIERQFLKRQLEEQRAKRAALSGQRAQKEAELATAKASIDKLEATLPILQQRVDIRHELYDHQTGSKVNYLEIWQALVEAQQELLVQRSKSEEAKAALAALIQSEQQAQAEFQRTLYSDLVEAKRKAAGLHEDVIKATQRAGLQSLTSPVDGVVQQLAIHTVGGVVTPAQSLLMVVPEDSGLEIEAMVKNRDIGFVHVGQKAAIKVDTFDFTRYGLIPGNIVSLSQDAIIKDNPPSKDESRGASNPSGGNDQGEQSLVYAARIMPERTQMQVDENLINLSPGMAVTIEIKTGSRSVLSYVLAPLFRYGQESLKER
jgi:hemolysin D